MIHFAKNEGWRSDHAIILVRIKAESPQSIHSNLFLSSSINQTFVSMKVVLFALVVFVSCHAAVVVPQVEDQVSEYLLHGTCGTPQNPNPAPLGKIIRHTKEFFEDVFEGHCQNGRKIFHRILHGQRNWMPRPFSSILLLHSTCLCQNWSSVGPHLWSVEERNPWHWRCNKDLVL